MRMQEDVRKEFSKQINKEYYSAFLYLQMSDWLAQNNWKGCAHWMYIQYMEELAHAQGLFEYLQMRGIEVELDLIEKAEKKEWQDVLEVFEDALEHEQKITGWINDLVDLSAQAGDKAAVIFLDWYVIEQVEEEANQEDNVDSIKRTNGKEGPLLMWDNKMGTRVFDPPEIPYLD